MTLQSDLAEPFLPSSESYEQQQQPTSNNDDTDQSSRQQQQDQQPTQGTTSSSDHIVEEVVDKNIAFGVNHNVFLNLLLCVLYGVSDSLWSGTVIVAYLKKLGHDRNSPVGDIEATNGLAALLSALPVGYLADKVGRAKVIRGGGVLLLVTAILHAYLLEWIGTDEAAAASSSKNKNDFWLLGAIMALWGIGGGIVNGPAQALYADSTPVGQRSTYYTYLFAAYMISSCVGPLVSIALFETIGDDWDLYSLRSVLYVGLGLEVLNALVMMFFDDRKALDEEEEEENDDNQEQSETAAATSRLAPQTSDEEQPISTVALNSSRQESLQEAGTEISEASSDEQQRLKEQRKYIPYIIFVSSCIMAIGSGMTVKFFPLFFKDEVGMSPSHVQIIYTAVPIAMVACSGIGTKLAAAGFGRVQAALLLKASGVSGLYAMVFAKSYLDIHPYVLVPIYVMRTALVNSPYPLQESVLMDYVPKNQRARWKSLDSVCTFGWCGSAALGGWLTDRYDYTYTFFITAVIQSIGILVFALLLPLVPRKESRASEESSAEPLAQEHLANVAVAADDDDGDERLRPAPKLQSSDTLPTVPSTSHSSLLDPLIENDS